MNGKTARHLWTQHMRRQSLIWEHLNWSLSKWLWSDYPTALSMLGFNDKAAGLVLAETVAGVRGWGWE